MGTHRNLISKIKPDDLSVQTDLGTMHAMSSQQVDAALET